QLAREPPPEPGRPSAVAPLLHLHSDTAQARQSAQAGSSRLDSLTLPAHHSKTPGPFRGGLALSLRRLWFLALLLLSCDLTRSIQQTSDKAIAAIQGAVS